MKEDCLKILKTKNNILNNKVVIQIHKDTIYNQILMNLDNNKTKIILITIPLINYIHKHIYHQCNLYSQICNHLLKISY